ncbi:MAG TPA: ABC transporter permease [Solirubrobacteraceae bacterium]|jgi:peptide/nickel transport system permease protein|nr:ABC transporter permease [Solirubrobacteraceae bacterium]
MSALERPLARLRPWPASRWVGIALLGSVALASIVIPVVSHYSTDAIDVPLQAPSGAHPFGTDNVGRDVFVRTFAAGRIDLLLAIVVVASSALVGTLIGTVAGASRRRAVDALIMRVVDAIIAFPFIVLVLGLVVVIGPTVRWGFIPAGLPSTGLALVFISWAFYARIARAEALSLRERDYVVAARTLGYTQARIVTRHLMPSTIRICTAFAVGHVIVVVAIVASLAFLGSGVQPPTPEWGSLMHDGSSLLQIAWWITVLPGVVLVITGLGLSLIADSILRERSN